MNNRDLKDYESWSSEQNSAWARFQKNINVVQIIALLGAIYLAWFMLKSGGSNSKWYLIGLGVILLVIIFKKPKQTEQEPIPEPTIKILAKMQLDRRIGDNTGQIPSGSTIRMMLQGGIRWQGEWGQAFTPWQWGVGFIVRFPDGLEKDYICILHPYRGYITKIDELPYGWNNKWQDLKVLMPSLMKTDGQANQSGLSITK